jgi:hypothetical protein
MPNCDLITHSTNNTIRGNKTPLQYECSDNKQLYVNAMGLTDGRVKWKFK